MSYIDEIAEHIRQKVPAELVPEPETADLFRIYAVLALALGSQVEPADVHNAWAAWMASLNPEHEALRPFSELPPDVQSQDAPFVHAIRRAAEDLNLTRRDV